MRPAAFGPADWHAAQIALGGNVLRFGRSAAGPAVSLAKLVAARVLAHARRRPTLGKELTT